MSSKKNTIKIDGTVYDIAADLYGMRLFAKKKGFNHVDGIQEFFGTLQEDNLGFDQMDDICLMVQAFIESAEKEQEAPSLKKLYQALFSEPGVIEKVFETISESMPSEEKELGNGKKRQTKRKVKAK